MIRLLYETRKFSEHSVAQTLLAFRFHIAGLFFIALNRILAPAFYAQSDTKRPTFAGIASFVVNMIVAFLLAKRFKGGGIAFALSFAALVNTVILLCFLKAGRLAKILPAILGILVLSIAAYFCTRAAYPALSSFFDSGNRFLRYVPRLVIAALIFGGFGAVGVGLYKILTTNLTNHANKNIQK
jgi:putative peptidoglycan lipid II flippase